MTPGGVLVSVARRDLQLAFRRWGDILSPLIFFALVASLFPLALSPRPETLRTLGPAVLWIAALLATLISTNALFRADVEDGSMEQLVVGPHPLPLIMLGKTIAHWIAFGLPLVALAPLLAVTYHLPPSGAAALCLTLLLGTPTLSLLGSIGAALTASVRQTGGLLAFAGVAADAARADVRRTRYRSRRGRREHRRPAVFAGRIPGAGAESRAVRDCGSDPDQPGLT